jgi:iron(III) transport system substrate-binding protein
VQKIGINAVPLQQDDNINHFKSKQLRMNNLKNAFLLFFLSVGLMLATSCTSPPVEEVNVYSARHYQTDEDLFEKFTEETGIRVNLIKAGADQLINRLEMERTTSPADLFITADAGYMLQAREKDLLQPMDRSITEGIVPSYLYDSEGYWTGFTKRARIVVYHAERVDPSGLSTYEALTDPRWKGRILVRTSQNAYNQTLMASIIAAKGEEAALEWAKGMVANMAQEPRGNDRDQIKAIAAEVGDVAIVNTYYMGLMLHSSNEEERRVAKQMGVFFPNQDGRGAHMNISAAAIAKNAPNKANAEKLISFFLRNDSQQLFAEVNHEYPANINTPWTELQMQWGEFKPDTIPLDQLTPHLSKATKLFNEAGWK